MMSVSFATGIYVSSFLVYINVSVASLEESVAFYFTLVSAFSVEVSLSFANRSFDL